MIEPTSRTDVPQICVPRGRQWPMTIAFRPSVTPLDWWLRVTPVFTDAERAIHPVERYAIWNVFYIFQMPNSPGLQFAGVVFRRNTRWECSVHAKWTPSSMLAWSDICVFTFGYHEIIHSRSNRWFWEGSKSGSVDIVTYRPEIYSLRNSLLQQLSWFRVKRWSRAIGNFGILSIVSFISTLFLFVS